MRNQIMEDIAWELDKLIEKELALDPYRNEEVVRRMVSEEFAKWLVEKFKEETGYEA